MTATELFALLSAPFPPAKVSWRVGSTTGDKAKGMALAYIDSRDVMDRFNEACGPFGWQSRHEVAPDGKKVTCSIGVLNPDTGAWIWRSDGAGETDVEGEKGSYSDSLKRAAVSFGVGRYLYDLDSPWVELDTYEKQGKVFAKGIKSAEKQRLQALLAKDARKPQDAKPAPAAVPQQGKPEPAPAPRSRAEIAKEWAMNQVPKIATMNKPELDAFTLKFRAQIADLPNLDKAAGMALDKAVADRLEALFA